MNLNLGTKYLGLQLANPLVIAACPITGKIDWLKKLPPGELQGLGTKGTGPSFRPTVSWQKTCPRHKMD